MRVVKPCWTAQAPGGRGPFGGGYWRRAASGDAQWRNDRTDHLSVSARPALLSLAVFGCPRQDSNLRSRLRRWLVPSTASCEDREPIRPSVHAWSTRRRASSSRSQYRDALSGSSHAQPGV